MSEQADGLRELLAGAGYEIAFRDGAWIECLVCNDAECWVGRGTSRGEALQDATRTMFPSRAARRLLDHALAPPVATEMKAPPGVEPKAALPVEAVAAFVSTAAVEAPAATPQPPIAPPPPLRVPADPPPAAFEEPAPSDGPEPLALSTGRLDRLIADIDACQPVLACLAPERQRLWLLIWICRARAEQEIHPSSQEIHRGVARVARRLGEIAKTFWPGSVRALQLNASAADVGLGRRQGEGGPRTWTDAAVAAEKALDEHLAQSERSGLDEDGWADAALLEPRPDNADAMLAQVASEIEELAAAQTPSDASPERLAQLGRMVRWMRRSVADAVRWGTAMGRLRQIAFGLGERGEALRDICDPRHKPKRGWASAATVDAPRAPEPPPSVADPPPADEGPQALAAWLVGAFVLDTPTLAAKIATRKDDVCALDDSALPSGDRRLRRRFRELKRRLETAEVVPEAAPASEAADSKPADDEPSGASRMLEGLAAAVRPRTQGRRALFVSNRHDPPLQAKLEEVLGLSITWCEATPRRVQAQAERVAHGAFDLVLSATGFQVHAVDTALSKAAKASSVPLVRVDRGRPLACVRAIAREFGIADSVTASN